MEVNPLPKKIENTNIFNSFDIYECLCPHSECTGGYAGLGLRFRCLCDCHFKQLPTERDGITDKAVLTNIKIGASYTGLSKYTVHTINRQYSKDGKIAEQHSDVIPLSIQKLGGMCV